MDPNNILDSNFNQNGQRVELISINKFVLLFVVTMGLYGAWWMYKSWRFFKIKDRLDIFPEVRAIFAIIFLLSLLDTIRIYAERFGYNRTFSPVLLFFGFILLNISGYLPNPYWLLSLLSFTCLLPAVDALNFAIDKDENYEAVLYPDFNQRQVVLLFAFGTLWAMTIMDYMMK